MGADLPNQLTGKPLNLLQKIRWQVVFGKIDMGLEPGQRPDQPLPPALVYLSERPLHLPERLAPLLFRVGIDQICNALGCRQIQLPVLEGPPRELPGIRGPQTRNQRQFVDNSGKDGAAAMKMQLRHILAAEAGWPRKRSHQAVI